MLSCCLRCALQPSASAPSAFSKLFQHFRVRGHPCGLQDTLSTLRPSCSPWSKPQLRHGRKTRYGWVANPDPTGTFTLQETPSLLGAITLGLSAGPQGKKPRLTQKRALWAVRSEPWFGEIVIPFTLFPIPRLSTPPLRTTLGPKTRRAVAPIHAMPPPAV
jgi:hypothetical protein